MSNEQHQGASPVGPLSQSPDRRIVELANITRNLRSTSAVNSASAVASDPNSIQHLSQHLLGGQMNVGLIVHSMPHFGWYKVQVGDGRGFIGACNLSPSGFVPNGVRTASVLPPNSLVLIYTPRGLNYGIILGVLPPQLRDGRIVNPDWLVQGGQSGYKREAAHKYPLQYLYRNGGVIDFSGQRPIDGTAFEWGQISSTGIGILIDDAQTYLRVHEQCGLFLNSIDGHARLAGMQMDVASLVHEMTARDDEGEAFYFEGRATYPWEALGLASPGSKFTQTSSDQAVQYEDPRAKIDLAEGEEDLQPIYRYQEYGGYLGQGSLRMVVRPSKTNGKQFMHDETVDEGLFCEAISIDGDYSLRSAKSVHIGRRVRIIVPQLRKLLEDAEGDDAEKGNYKFSGKFGGGEEHKLSEVAVDGEHKQMRRIAAVNDLIAFMCNWKTLHPFHYHAADYSTAQESDQTEFFSQVQEPLDFDQLKSQPFLRDPEPRRLKIDHRYNDALYFERESFIHFTEDGSIILAAGDGTSLELGGGSIRAAAPGDVILAPGRSVVALGEQVVLRAKRSVDISASEHDVRIKAERNMQVMAGNGGQGGMLFEAKGKGVSQLYDKRIGEDVVSNGIVFKAADSICATVAKETYFRTTSGDIVFDADKGRRNMLFYGKSINMFAANEVSFFYGPSNENSDVNKVYYFGKAACNISSHLLLGGSLINYSTSANIFGGGVYGGSNIIAVGMMAAKNKSGFLGKTPDTFGSFLSGAINSVSSTQDTLKQMGKTQHATNIVSRFYKEKQIGNDDLVRTLTFSFRDDHDETQYGVKNFRWLERRWEQMIRLGSATGGTSWEEKPVDYQGEQLYPWPGRRKWKEDAAFLRLESLTMSDPATGGSRDRPGPYEEPKLSGWQPTTMADGFKLVR